MMRFKFLEGIAIADVAFEAYGKSLEEAFSNAALAMFEVETNTKKVKPKIKKKVKVEGEDLQALLFDWLSELLFLGGIKRMFFSKFNVKIKKLNGRHKLNAEVYGEKIDRKRHELKVEVKAVSYQMMQVIDKPKNCKVRVILDV